MTGDTMTTSEVQELLGLGSAAAARVQLRRWRVAPIGRTLSGEKTWPADTIRDLAGNRPGRGARTDLEVSPRTP